jgi:hypothetical protein
MIYKKNIIIFVLRKIFPFYSEIIGAKENVDIKFDVHD